MSTNSISEAQKQALADQAAWLESQKTQSTAGSTTDGSFSQALEDILPNTDAEGLSVDAEVGGDGQSLAGSIAKGDRNSGLFEPKKNLDKQDFLLLLTTQMRFQDPLEPQDNAQFISQLAQFSSLEANTNILTAINGLKDSLTQKDGSPDVVKAIGDLKDSLKTPSSQTGTSQTSISDTMGATALLGKTVRVATEVIGIQNYGEYADIRVHNQSSAPLNLVISDSTGKAVKTVPVREFDENGDGIFQWDGTLDDGSLAQPGFYGIGLQGGTDADYIYSEGSVKGVRFGKTGVTLNVSDADTSKEQEVSMGDLIRVDS
jgi:flagellar basal-body rod modification protein FlgD